MLNPLPPSVTVSTPGTCGELVQGWHPGWQQPVLVSCPIDRNSRVTACLRDDPAIHVTGSEAHSYRKAWQAARLALDALGARGVGISLHIDSDLPSGRGFAASTADVVGTLAAVGELLGCPFSPAQLAELACRIEPSDSIMFSPATMLAYRDSGQSEMLGTIPTLPCIVLDPGEAVDTVTYNARLNLHHLRELADTTQAALNLLVEGLTHHDPIAIGAATTLSASAYQVVNYSGLVARAQQWAAATGAVGVVRAHSGSLVGLLYPPGTPLTDAVDWLATQFEGHLIQTQLVGAGYRVLEPQPARITEVTRVAKNGTQINTDFTDYVKIYF